MLKRWTIGEDRELIPCLNGVIGLAVRLDRSPQSVISRLMTLVNRPELLTDAPRGGPRPMDQQYFMVIIQLFRTGLNVNEIASEVGWSRNYVQARIDAAGYRRVFGRGSGRRSMAWRLARIAERDKELANGTP